jgi:hypothetical protein
MFIVPFQLKFELMCSKALKLRTAKVSPVSCLAMGRFVGAARRVGCDCVDLSHVAGSGRLDSTAFNHASWLPQPFWFRAISKAPLGIKPVAKRIDNLLQSGNCHDISQL